MKIFISWSGDASHAVAKALKDWLPNVFQAIQASDVFLSSEDIPIGSQWFNELGKVLDQCDFGVLCLTRANMTEPWILYEAGAVSKRLEHARVAPMLIGLKNTDLASPLDNFNAAGVDEAGVRRLLNAINEQLGSGSLNAAKLDNAFKAFWPQLNQTLAPVTALLYKFDVFLSTPMAAFPDDAAFQAWRAKFSKVYDALRDSGLKVYWAAAAITSMADYETIDVSVMEDLAALDQSRHFVLLYPEMAVTSVLFEAGYALARKLPSIYFVRERDDLPFLMRELGSNQQVRIQTQDYWKDFDKLAGIVKKQKDSWFPK